MGDKAKKIDMDTLQALLESDEDVPVEILPNGEIRQTGEAKSAKPLTMREKLGGEYGL